MDDFLNGNGTPCLNCESYAATDEFVHFCSAECKDEYNGEGEFAEENETAPCDPGCTCPFCKP